jgi:hypothetical protein
VSAETELAQLVLDAIDAHQPSPLHPIDFDELAQKILSVPSSRRVVEANLPELLSNYARTAVGVRGAEFSRPASVVDLNPPPSEK